jgi:hypothetical protein
MVKPLYFTTPAVITAAAASSTSPSLTQLTSHLTPAQAQTIDHLLHSVKQLSATGLSTNLHAVQPQLTARNKPLMPKAIAPPVMTSTLPVPAAHQKMVIPVPQPQAPLPPPATLPPIDGPPRPPAVRVNKPRKPCHCKNSQCLKLYCDCFANGEFCREGCQCHNCKNNVDHAEERARAIKICLDRNPHAFKPKVGPNKSVSRPLETQLNEGVIAVVCRTY